MSALQIRMYHVGFGDCFLLTFGAGSAAERHLLVDCGSISTGAAQVTKVTDDVIKTCKGRIELVVCTHRHRDHVGGFADPRWSSVVVGEVWMPWTEDPTDPDATRIRNGQSGFAAGLAKALRIASDKLDEDPLAVDAPEREQALQATQALTLNALTNEKAMQTLHSGFSGNSPRYFLPVKGTNCEARNVEGLPGIVFHILGPPRDEEAIKNMDPPQGAAYFAVADDSGAPALASEAFRPRWRLDRAAFDKANPESTFDLKDQKQLDTLADEPDGNVAAAIDRAVNNTSLIMMIEAGSQWLLFPGDAQWGSWNAAMSDDNCKSLMKRTTFYKVGHHGSHNATPRVAVDDLFAQGLISFFSTASIKQWPDVPRGPLVEAISKKGKIARSDMEDVSEKAGFTVEDGLYTEWTVDTGA